MLHRWFRWSLDPVRDAPGVLMEERGSNLSGMAACVGMAVVLALPPVSRALGIPPWIGAVTCLPFAVWVTFVSRVLAPLAKRHVAAFHVAAVGNAVMANLITGTIATSTGDPRSLLWSVHLVYAAINGALESGPIGWLFLLHVGTPLLAIPFLPESAGADRYGGPLVVAVLSAIAYGFLSRLSLARVRLRTERDEALARVREQQAELARLRLARDLHDSVGASLALLRLYADLVERSAGREEETRRLATQIRDAAADGLGDLRGALEAISPREESVAALVDGFRLLASRVPVTVEVEAEGDTERALPSDLRLALVRVFQEGVRNAITHGQAGRVRVTIRVHEELSLEIADDGQGFDPAMASEGRGLPSMQARAAELGGTFQLESRRGAGTRVRIGVPSLAALSTG